MDGDGYLLDNAQVEARERFTALADLFDAWTFRHLEAGVRPGARVWEVGAGGPGVPTWLAEQVLPGGSVLVTDIDTRWLTGSTHCEVRTHDVGVDPTPEPASFDVVHARLVLVHLPRRAAALASMVAALRPGGLLVLEEADPALQPLVCPDESGPEQELANRLKAGFRTLMVRRGVDLAYGRTLPRLLRGAGLVDVEAEAFFPVTNPACAVLEAATVRQIGGGLVDAGLATPEEIDRHLAAVTAGRLDLTISPLVTAWGRKPG